MKYKIILSIVYYVYAVFSLFVITSCGPTTSNMLTTNSSRKIVTPEMLKFFEEDFSRSDKVDYRIIYFSLQCNWCCIHVEPTVNGIIGSAEPRWILLKKKGNDWESIDWSQGVAFTSDFEAIDLPDRDSKIARAIVRNFPDCPMEIFPLPRME